MKLRLYSILRDLHLYAGLFLAPFVLLFAVSVFFLVHAWIPGSGEKEEAPRTVAGVVVPAGLEALDGRARVDALQSVLPSLGVRGEIGFVRYRPKQRLFEFSVVAPGRETGIVLDVAQRTASIARRDTGFWDGLVTLHKSPGQHLVAIRMNWWPMRAWRWFADATVYLLFFISLSGIYLWAVLRPERKAGLALLAAGALTFAGAIYAIVH